MKDPIFENKRIEKIILGAVLALAFCIRWYKIAIPSLWSDEIFTAGRVALKVPDMIRELRDSPFPPLYYLTVKASVLFLGLSEFSLRLPALLFSVLSVFMIYKLGKALFGSTAGLITAFLVALSAYQVNYAQEAKMYSMLWFFAIGSFLYFFRWLRSKQNKDLFLYAVFTDILIYTSYHGLIFLVLQNFYFIFYAGPKKFREWGIAQAAVLAVFFPWAASLFKDHLLDTISWVRPTDDWLGYGSFFKTLFLTSLDLVRPVHWELPVQNFGAFTLIEKVHIILYFFLFILSLVRFSKNKTRLRVSWDLSSGEVLALSWAALPFFFYFLLDKLYHPIFVLRYMSFVHIPVYLLIGKTLSRFSYEMFFPCLVFITAAAVTFHLFFYFYDEAKINGQDWRGVGRFLNEKACDNSVPVFSEFLKPPGVIFKRGFRFYCGCSDKIIYESELSAQTRKHEHKPYLLIFFPAHGPLPGVWDDFKIAHGFSFKGLTAWVYFYKPRTAQH